MKKGKKYYNVILRLLKLRETNDAETFKNNAAYLNVKFKRLDRVIERMNERTRVSNCVYQTDGNVETGARNSKLKFIVK